MAGWTQAQIIECWRAERLRQLEGRLDEVGWSDEEREEWEMILRAMGAKGAPPLGDDPVAMAFGLVPDRRQDPAWLAGHRLSAPNPEDRPAGRRWCTTCRRRRGEHGQARASERRFTGVLKPVDKGHDGIAWIDVGNSQPC